jgi:type IV pilus assembly protein PilW
MKERKLSMAGQRQRGLSLVELMVAMVLGLLIMAAVVQLFLTNRQTFNLQQGIASVQEQGRFAVDFLSKEIMWAGFGDVPAAFKFSDGNVSASEDGAPYDTIYVLLDTVGDASSNPRDCSGGELNQNGDDNFDPAETFKKYHVNVEDDGNGVLMCSDSDGSSTVLIDNVEAFQVLFGVADGPDDNRVFRYVSADQINGSEEIVSVRFAILVASDEVAVSERNQALPVDIFGTSFEDDVDFNDGRLRRLFVSSVAIRNRQGG